MTHEELLAEIDERIEELHNAEVCDSFIHALRAVVELHKPTNYLKDVGIEDTICSTCGWRGIELYPCPTIQAIEKELNA